MAKRKQAKAPGQEETEVASAVSAGEGQLLDFAEDLGRMLGTAQRKADEWLGQRENLTKRLTELRDTATGLLNKLQGGAAEAFNRGRKRGRPASTGNAAPSEPPRRGRPPGSGKKRTMSAEARARIGEAQKRRWAKQKASNR